MGTIVDLVGLVTRLNDSVKDRKFAAELREIQRMINTIQSEQATLTEKNIKLMSDNAKLKDTVASLQNTVSNPNKNAAIPNNPLSDEEKNILVFLSEHEDATSNQVAHSLSLNNVKVEYWLENLNEMDMVHCSFAINSPTMYDISHKGRGYLMKNDII